MKKIRTSQVQAQFPGPYNVFHLVYFDFYCYYYIEKYLLCNGDIAFKHMYALSE